ncbi:universal stress protein [Oxalobacteraceae bacterium OM1]|nr:universal stress protein [Oxalobacteraceae bacterium OM1]
MPILRLLFDTLALAALAAVTAADLLPARGNAAPVLVRRGTAPASYRRVLVAVDFSGASLVAVRCAMAIAPDAQITLLHVCGKPSATDTLHPHGMACSDAGLVQRHAHAMERLTRFTRDLGACSQLLSRVVRFGTPDLAFASYAERMRADLLVMPSTSLASLRFDARMRVLLRLFRSTECDVLAIPPALATAGATDAGAGPDLAADHARATGFASVLDASG